jgi:hypothetical protein
MKVPIHAPQIFALLSSILFPASLVTDENTPMITRRNALAGSSKQPRSL